MHTKLIGCLRVEIRAVTKFLMVLLLLFAVQGVCHAQDSDSDGLSDVDEGTYGTDPYYWDTDYDTLSDGDEVYIWGTDPLVVDTDSDGYSDGVEVGQGYDPTDPNSNYASDLSQDHDMDGLSSWMEIYVVFSDPGLQDTDSDMIWDGEEYSVWSTDPTNPDTDFDSVRDDEEVWWYITNPNNPDTDGDGYDDGTELYTNFTDPTDPLSF